MQIRLVSFAVKQTYYTHRAVAGSRFPSTIPLHLKESFEIFYSRSMWLHARFLLFSTTKTGVAVLYRDSTRSALWKFQSFLFPKPTTRTTLWREADLEARVLLRPLLQSACSCSRWLRTSLLGFCRGWRLAEKSPHSLRVASRLDDSIGNTPTTVS